MSETTTLKAKLVTAALWPLGLLTQTILDDKNVVDMKQPIDNAKITTQITTLDLNSMKKSSAQIKEELFAEMVSALCDCAPHVSRILSSMFEEYLAVQALEKQEAESKYYDL